MPLPKVTLTNGSAIPASRLAKALILPPVSPPPTSNRGTLPLIPKEHK